MARAACTSSETPARAATETRTRRRSWCAPDDERRARLRRCQFEAAFRFPALRTPVGRPHSRLRTVGGSGRLRGSTLPGAENREIISKSDHLRSDEHMTLRLTIENMDRLPDGGPVRVEVKGRGLDIGRDQHLDWTLAGSEPPRFQQALRNPLSRRRLLAARRLDQRHIRQRRAVPARRAVFVAQRRSPVHRPLHRRGRGRGAARRQVASPAPAAPSGRTPISGEPRARRRRRTIGATIWRRSAQERPPRLPRFCRRRSARRPRSAASRPDADDWLRGAVAALSPSPPQATGPRRRARRRTPAAPSAR